MEAFRVLPQLSGQPPPPSTPHSPRVAPRYRQQKESSAFVVLAEVGSGASGRASPFRGRGFKAPVVSKIPVKSAPSSPGPRAPKPAFGKSAPTTPSKRVTTSRQPGTPKKPLARPVPKPRFLQNTVPKDDRSKAAPTKPSNNDNKVARKRSDTLERISTNKKVNEGGESMNKNMNVTEGMVAVNTNDAGDIAKTERSRLRNLNEKNSTVGKSSVTNNRGSNVPTTRVAKPAVGRIAVTLDRVNRLRPDKHMINSTRPVTRNSLRSKTEPPESKVNTGPNSSDMPQNTKSKPITAENESLRNKLSNADKSFPRYADISTNDKSLAMENEHHPLTPVPSDNIVKEILEDVKQVELKVSSVVAPKPAGNIDSAESNQNHRSELETASSNFQPAENNNILKLPSPYSTVPTSPSSNGLTASAGSVGLVRDNEDSSNSSHSSSQLTLVTGTTQANVEPVKGTSGPPYHNTDSNDANVPTKKEEVGTNHESGLETKLTNKSIIVGAVENDLANNIAELIPNGDIHARHEVVNVINGGGIHQNKIIIHQRDMNGPVHVIGSEPVLISELDEVIKESIVTETVVPSEDLVLRKEAQPDLIPSDQVEEPQVTVIGQPDVEVEAGNHTVTFRYSRGNGSMEPGLMPPLEYVEMKNTGKISPEIHPVSARKNKRRSVRDLCGCCRPAAKGPKGCSWKLPWFRKRNGPGPPPPPKVKKKTAAFSSLFSCTKCKGKGTKKNGGLEPPQLQTGLQEPKQLADASEVPKLQVQPKEKEKLCRKIFCCGCSKKGPTRPQLLAPKKKSYLTKLFCCCGGKKSDGKPKPLQSQELLKNRRREMSKSRTTSIQSGFSKLEMSLVEHSSMMRAAIPVLPICLAWTCLILNVFLPGTGTMTSGILCLCFGKPRFSVNDTAIARLGALCVNLVIGFGQIFTIIFCLVGWGWSIWWGIIMLRLARKHRRIKLAEKNSIQPRAVNQNHDVERGH